MAVEKDPRIELIIDRLREKGREDHQIAMAIKLAYRKTRGAHVHGSKKDKATGKWSSTETVPYSARRSLIEGTAPTDEELKNVYGLQYGAPKYKVNENLVSGMQAFTPPAEEPAAEAIKAPDTFSRWQKDKDLSLWLDAEGVTSPAELERALAEEGIDAADGLPDFETWVRDRWVPKHVTQKTVEA